MSKIYKFLIIDDDQSIRKILGLRLASFFQGCEITESEYLKDARIELEKSSFDLVFLDQHLPDGLGVEISAEIYKKEIPIIAMSSDDSPTLPGQSILKGASTFVPKSQISNLFFLPLAASVIEKNELQKKVKNEENLGLVINTIQKLINTLKHEINNPLGAVYGAIYLLGHENISLEDKKKALDLLSQSSKRIHEVLTKLSDASSLDSVMKGKEELFHVPGDKDWK